MSRRFRRPAQRIRRSRGGTFQLRLPEEERSILRSMCDELRGLIRTEDASTARLFPPGYTDDPVANRQYAELVRDDLVAGRMAAIETVERTLEATTLSEDQLSGWLTALNDLRLVLGTRLDVTEELYETGLAPDDPRFPTFAVYEYLGWLQDQVVEALAAGLDPSGTERA